MLKVRLMKTAGAHQRHKSDCQYIALAYFAIMILMHQQQLLRSERGAYRYHQVRIGFQLFHQGFRNIIRGGGDNNGIIRCMFRPAFMPVTQLALDIVVTQPGKFLLCGFH
jgi:hypothetical protein